MHTKYKFNIFFLFYLSFDKTPIIDVRRDEIFLILLLYKTGQICDPCMSVFFALDQYGSTKTPHILFDHDAYLIGVSNAKTFQGYQLNLLNLVIFTI